MGHIFPFVVVVQGHPKSLLYAILTNTVVSMSQKKLWHFSKKCIKCTSFINITNNLLLFSHEGLCNF
jgi:hypothetical protein